ncbi:MAG: hypothetical protein ACFFD5_02845 [Candidatus Thorarchaeota archaeon]
MEDKYSLKTQSDITQILSSLEVWKKQFSFDISYYYEGWAINLTEKSIYPRLIVIFSSYHDDSYSVKSFEIYFDEHQKKFYKELYVNNKLDNILDLMKEINEIIYGKDLINSISKEYDAMKIK